MVRIQAHSRNRDVAAASRRIFCMDRMHTTQPKRDHPAKTLRLVLGYAQRF